MEMILTVLALFQVTPTPGRYTARLSTRQIWKKVRDASELVYETWTSAKMRVGDTRVTTGWLRFFIPMKRLLERSKSIVSECQDTTSHPFLGNLLAPQWTLPLLDELWN